MVGIKHPSAISQTKTSYETTEHLIDDASIPLSKLVNQPVSPYSYIIKKDPNFGINGLYHAKDSDYSVLWPSTDASYVAQQAINSLTSGNIFFRKGAYANMSLTMKSLVNLEGESVAYYSGAHDLGVTFEGSGNRSCLNYTGQSFITTKNIRLESDGVSDDIGLDLNPSVVGLPRYLDFDHVTVNGFVYNAKTGSEGQIFNNTFQHCHFVNPRAYDFYGVTSYQMMFVKTTFRKAAFLGGGNLSLHNCWFETTNYLYGEKACAIYSTSGFSVRDTYFQAEVGSESQSQLLSIADSSHGGVVKGNRFVGVAAGFTYGIVIDSGAECFDLELSPNVYGTNITNLLQYPYYKGNDAIINNIVNTSATTFVFNHTLYRTPTDVQCTFDLTVGYIWTWTATSTQVTVTVTPLSGVTLPGTYHILSANLHCATS
jgi:hypothetical protein